MKKTILFLIILFSITLTSCKKNNSDLSVDSILPTIDTCDDDCTTEDENFNDYFETEYQEKLDSYYDKIGSIDGFSSGFLVAGTYDRDTLNKNVSLRNNDDIYYFSGYQKAILKSVTYLRTLQRHCDLTGECDAGSSSIEYSNVSYGYDDKSGYFEATVTAAGDGLNHVQGRYNFNDEFGRSEYIHYQPNSKTIMYMLVMDEHVYDYEYSEMSERYTYNYVNLETHESIHLSVIDDDIILTYYDPISEINYTYKTFEHLADIYKVSKYNNQEFVASLSTENDSYELITNMHFVDGWDTIEKETNFSDGILYEDGTRVFSDYTIDTGDLEEYYNVVNASLTGTSIDDLQYPSGFNGDITITDLESELSSLSELEDPTTLFDKTLETIFEIIETTYNQIETEYE